ncbi:hypothetical protein D3C72_2255020 [compost metagenome]
MPVVSVSSTTDLVAISAQLSIGQSCKNANVNTLDGVFQVDRAVPIAGGPAPTLDLRHSQISCGSQPAGDECTTVYQQEIKSVCSRALRPRHG